MQAYLFYLFINTQQKDQEAFFNTVSRSTKSEKHTWHAIYKTQANGKEEKET